MDLGSVEEKVAALDLGRGFDLIYDLLDAYGFAKSSLKRLQTGSLNKATGANEVIWLKNVYWRFIPEDEQGSDVHLLIDAAASDARILKQRPRFLIVSDGVQLVARDMKTSDTLDVPLERLRANVEFFLPWAGIEKAQLESLHYADVKAAEKMARLYDEILKLNAVSGSEDLHALNVFFTRLLFCFFAEDTGIFDKAKFTNAVASLTRADGGDVHSLLEQIFMVLDTTPEERGDVQSYLRGFGYVNGRLFSDWLPVPEFSAKARKIILECGELDWSEINPGLPRLWLTVVLAFRLLRVRSPAPPPSRIRSTNHRRGRSSSRERCKRFPARDPPGDRCHRRGWLGPDAGHRRCRPRRHRHGHA